MQRSLFQFEKQIALNHCMDINWTRAHDHILFQHRTNCSFRLILYFISWNGYITIYITGCTHAVFGLIFFLFQAIFFRLRGPAPCFALGPARDRTSLSGPDHSITFCLMVSGFKVNLFYNKPFLYIIYKRGFIVK